MWSKTNEHHTKVTASLQTIRYYVEKGKCMVAFSGGKDSTAMLHLALQVDPDIDVFNWDQGTQLMPIEIQTEILSNAKAIGTKNLIVEAWKGSEASDMRENPEKWRNAHLFHYLILNKVRKERGWNTQFVGLRKDESCKRSITVKKPRAGEVYPIAEWSYLDVWSYIVSHDLPYPKTYDLYAPLLGWDKARFVNFFSKRFEQFGSIYLDGFLLPEKRNVERTGA
jgi:3'-phosphoadenosine 5'-phosphosulfate sulfotransferase (PAPS reductase)/FAD synthetase